MKRYLLLINCMLILSSCNDQTNKHKGPIIKNHGSTYEVPIIDFETNLNQDYKVVFDIGRQFGDSTKVNPLINTAARYLNMHAKAGVPANKMNVALVVHGAAALDILSNKKYQEKYQIDNPNLSLLEELNSAGVQIILCGQTAAHRKINKNDTAKEVQFALSAMTALVTLQNEGYRLINF